MSTDAVAASTGTIAVGSDHAGYELKDALAEHLRGRGFEVLDLGTDGPGSVDYPDFGVAVGEAVAGGRASRGVCVCGTGIGICMAADKVHGVRAGTVHDETSARLARQHNNANVICMGARLIGPVVATQALDAWLDAEFEGGRHSRRTAKLDEM